VDSGGVAGLGESGADMLVRHARRAPV